MNDGSEEARRAVAALITHGLTVAVAESLTGGLVTARLVDVPGSSSALRGGIVSYATDLKHDLLGVDSGLLASRGPVDPDVAVMMAEGAAKRCHADLGLATTGVAGPEGQDGHAPGEVHIAVVGADLREVRSLELSGDRETVRASTVAAVLRLLLEVLDRRAASN